MNFIKDNKLKIIIYQLRKFPRKLLLYSLKVYISSGNGVTARN